MVEMLGWSQSGKFQSKPFIYFHFIGYMPKSITVGFGSIFTTQPQHLIQKQHKDTKP